MYNESLKMQSYMLGLLNTIGTLFWNVNVKKGHQIDNLFDRLFNERDKNGTFDVTEEDLAVFGSAFGKRGDYEA